MGYNVPTGINAAPSGPPLPDGGMKFATATAVTVTLVSGVAAGSVGNVNASKLTAEGEWMKQIFHTPDDGGRVGPRDPKRICGATEHDDACRLKCHQEHQT